MAYMLTKEKVQILCKFHLLFLTELAKKMNFLSVGKKVSSIKRKGQVLNFPVNIPFRAECLQELQILHFNKVEIV